MDEKKSDLRLPSTQEQHYIEIIGDKKLSLFNKNDKNSNVLSFGFGNRIPNIYSTKLFTRNPLLLLSFGYFRRHKINPTDIASILSNYIGTNECLLSNNKANITQHSHAQFYLCLPKLNESPMIKYNRIKHIEIVLHSNSCNQRQIFRTGSFLELGLIYFNKGGGINDRTSNEIDFEKSVNKVIDGEKKSRMYTTIGNKFSKIHQNYPLSNVIDFRWYRDFMGKYISFNKNNTTLKRINLKNDKKNAKYSMKKNDSLFIKIEMINNEHDDDCVTTEKGKSDEKENGINMNGSHLMYVSKDKDFGDLFGAKMTRVNKSKSIVNDLDEKGRILLDFNKFDYYFGFTMLQCNCNDVDGIEYRVRIE